MIKLAIAIRDEKYLQQLINRLRREKDIIFLSTIMEDYKKHNRIRMPKAKEGAVPVS